MVRPSYLELLHQTGSLDSVPHNIHPEDLLRVALLRRAGFPTRLGNYRRILTLMIPRASIQSLEATIGTTLSTPRRNLLCRDRTGCHRLCSRFSRPLRHPDLITAAHRSGLLTWPTADTHQRCHLIHMLLVDTTWLDRARTIPLLRIIPNPLLSLRLMFSICRRQCKACNNIYHNPSIYPRISRCMFQAEQTSLRDRIKCLVLVVVIYLLTVIQQRCRRSQLLEFNEHLQVFGAAGAPPAHMAYLEQKDCFWRF